jgi:hypothetical protein
VACGASAVKRFRPAQNLDAHSYFASLQKNASRGGIVVRTAHISVNADENELHDATRNFINENKFCNCPRGKEEI